mmetsp:Transcript_16612/g.22913  ORF Transcript_16612/g.22913 Transcript_16612/m.22913 type:complete len:124 (-) Transcript_16612:212-583(-)
MNPSEVLIKLVSEDGIDLLFNTRNRKLLNVEKLIFTTDPQSGLVKGVLPWIELSFLQQGARALGAQLVQYETIMFDISLEPLVVGIPQEAVPVIVAVVFLMVVSMRIAYALSNFHLSYFSKFK